MPWHPLFLLICVAWKRWPLPMDLFYLAKVYHLSSGLWLEVRTADFERYVQLTVQQGCAQSTETMHSNRFVLDPFLGWIAEHYGYRASLIVAGAFLSISGCVTMLIPLCHWFRGKKKNINQSDTVPTNTTSMKSDSSEWQERSIASFRRIFTGGEPHRSGHTLTLIDLFKRLIGEGMSELPFSFSLLFFTVSISARPFIFLQKLRIHQCKRNWLFTGPRPKIGVQRR